MATMGVLYDVLFKPIGRRDGGSATATTTTPPPPPPSVIVDVPATIAKTAAKTAAAGDNDHQRQQQQTTAPEWVLDERDGGLLVWRRYGGPAAASCGRRRVEFLDAVQVHVFERYDHGNGSGGDGLDSDSDSDDAAQDADAEDDADDGQLCWADDWCWDEWDDGGDGTGDGKRLFCRRPGTGPDDYPVLVAVSVTVLGLCFGLAYMFAPVRWLFHQLTVD